MITKTRKSRKAISPILATLLLVVIAVAAIVVTYAWVMTYMSNTTHQAGVIIYKANTYFNQTGTSKIDVDIGNSGTADTTLTALYVGTSTSTYVNQTMTPVKVNPNEVVRITIDYDWTSGVYYYFKVLTSNGLVCEWVDEAPVS